MPGSSMTSDGNLLFSSMLSLVLSPAIVGANTTAEQTFTVPGLQVGDFVNIIKPTTQAGLGIVNCRVSANNTLAIAFSNNTGGGLTPTAGERYLLMVDRFDGINVQNPPSAFV
jgi:hypothetical protein